MSFSEEVNRDCHHKLEEALNGVVLLTKVVRVCKLFHSFRTEASSCILATFMVVSKEEVESSKDFSKIVANLPITHSQLFEEILGYFTERVFTYFLIRQVAEVNKK